MFVPIILGSDKTTVSIASGQTEFYPLYFSIGNVHNNVRRGHRNALVLIGFLALPKGLLISNSTRIPGLTKLSEGSRKDDRSVQFRRFRRQLFHSSISAILQSLEPYMTTPDIVKCPDGHFRRAIYGIGPYIADYPEQVLVAGVVYGWCVRYGYEISCAMILANYLQRCVAPAKDLDQNFGDSMFRSREHTDLCSELLNTTELWERYGLLDDFTVCLSISFLLKRTTYTALAIHPRFPSGRHIRDNITRYLTSSNKRWLQRSFGRLGR